MKNLMALRRKKEKHILWITNWMKVYKNLTSTDRSRFLRLDKSRACPVTGALRHSRRPNGLLYGCFLFYYNFFSCLVFLLLI